MQKTLIFAAALVGAAFTANASVLFEDTWSTWTSAYQTAYGAGNGFLFADDDSTSNTNLAIANGNGSTTASALQDNSLYSFFSYPTFTFTNGESWTNVTTLVLEITYGGSSNEFAPISLFYNGIAAGAPVVSFVDNGATSSQDSNQFVNTYTWNFAEAVDLNNFAINYDTVGGHTAYGSFKLSVTAVPEPSTYAMILGGLGLVAAVAVRRRRA